MLAAVLGILAAVAPVKLERLEVALWPEYDRPAMLVMYRARLAAGTALPAIVTLPIPTAAEPHAVAKHAADGSLLVAPHSREVQGDWARIAITTDSLEVQLEYYADLTVEGRRRRFRWAWPGGMEVAALAYEVQQPAGATGFTLTPAEASSGVHPDGLTYHHGDLGGVRPGQKLALDVAYEKGDRELSAAPQVSPSPAAAPAPAPRPAASGGEDTIGWVVGGIAGALVLGALAWELTRPRT